MTDLMMKNEQLHRCPCCGKSKPSSEWHKNKTRKNGLSDKCKQCTKDYHQQNKHKSTLREIRYRAKQKGVPFDITVEDIVYPTVCPVFGIELKRGKDVPAKHSPSVDRIIPEKGYVKDNIQVLSQKANAMKQDATIEELIMFAEWVLNTYKKGKQ